MRIIILVVCLWLATGPLWGKIVFYSKRDGNSEIYTMNSDGSNQTRLTFNEMSDSSPVWSSNGQQIAFHSKRDGNQEVYVMDADGSNQRNLTRHPALDGVPYWSPDGNQIAFRSTQNGGKTQDLNIFVMNADGSNVKQITRMEFATNPQWSPDGKQILFEGAIDQGRQIYAIRPDGTDLWQVSKTKRDKVLFMGGWSPDGKKIVYAEEKKRQGRVAIPIVATRHPIQRRVFTRVPVEIPLKQHYVFSFSADGKSLLFIGRQNDADNWDIYSFRLADKQLTQLTDTPGDDFAPREWNPRLSVPPQELTSILWGEIKTIK